MDIHRICSAWLRSAVLVCVALPGVGCGDDADGSAVETPPTPTPETASAALRTLVGPGQHAAVWLDVSAGTEGAVDPAPLLTDAAVDAVARAPAWLRPSLRLRLGLVDATVQDMLAALLLEPPDERVVDEIAFSIANLPEGTFSLDGFDASLITENALAIYELDARLAYAEVVDTGAPGDDDYWSTIRYQYLDENGAEASYELPRDLYYWNVVHPVVEVDNLLPIDPATGERAASPVGVHWRRYVMDSSTETLDYRRHYLEREPNELGATLTGIGASAHLVTPGIYPLRVLVDEAQSGLLVELDLGAGTLLASTMDFASAYADGTTDPLVNLVTYGNTNVTLRSSARVAVVMDAMPWGSDVYSAALADEGIVPTVHTAAELAALDLTAYDKLIVAADQSVAFYQAIAARNAELDAWVRSGGVLELDLHASEDLSAIVFPNGVATAGAAPTSVVEEGQPRLADLIGGAEYVWDSVPYPDLSGDRPPPSSGLALDAVGWFVSQNLFDNVSERDAVAGDLERAQYPQRIVNNHYGNCGEIADLMAAAGRAALLPVRNVIEVEDHTWNEVWVAGRWVPWQVDWSDSATRIDSAAVGYDVDQGGSKNLSGLFSIRGDGYVDEWPGATYTDTATIEIRVSDVAGRPVDGAIAVVWTEAFYQPTEVTEAEVARTDADGVVTFVVGNGRNYWLYVGSAAAGGAYFPGELPSSVDFEDLAVLATAEETHSGAVITREVTLDVTLGAPLSSGMAHDGDGLGTARAAGRRVGSWIVSGTLYQGNPDADDSLGKVLIESPRAPLRYFLLDQPSYDAFAAGLPFAALAQATDVAELALPEKFVASHGAVWLVAHNPSVMHSADVELELEVTVP